MYLRVNIPNIHNNINDISSFQAGLNVLFSSTGFYFKSKVIKGSHKGEKYVSLIFGHFLPKCTFLRLWHFFLALWLSSQVNFSVAVHIYKIHVFDEVFFLLLSECLWSPNFSGCEELSHMNMHDISAEWFCGVTWQIKYISQPAEDISTPH